MTAFIVRRVLIMLLLLLLLSFAVFFLFSILPADVARLTCGKICTDQTIELNRARLGLDKSIFEQYWLFLSAIFVGRTYGIGEGAVVCEAPCLGWSFTKSEPVLELILDRLPATVFLALGAFVIFLIGGVSLGVYSALRRGRWQDKAITGVSLVGYSLPSFFIGLVVIFFVIIRWQLLPFPDYVNPWEDPVQFLQTMILPWIVLAILYAAFYTRLTRSQMLETQRGNDTARDKYETRHCDRRC